MSESFAIYNADCWCDECADAIKRDLANKIIAEIIRPGMKLMFPHSSLDFPSERLEEMTQAIIEVCDNSTMDSDDWPSSGHPEESVDSPSHCGAHEECLEAEDLGDGCKIGKLLGTSLTPDGVNYLNEMIGQKSVNDHQRRVHEFWRQEFHQYDLVADPDNSESSEDEPDDRDGMTQEFTESEEGDVAKQNWAENYDELNGAPEGDHDR